MLKHFSNISEYHKFVDLPPPLHPLISLIDYGRVKYPPIAKEMKITHAYYTIGLKKNVKHKFYYGQNEYDFDEGLMTFIAPNQIISLKENPNIKSFAKPSGYLLHIHPDFIWNSTLANKFKSCGFFGYALHEALFLSHHEEIKMVEILKNIEQECKGNMDKFSQKIIHSQIELLLNYTERFYQRQFLTRDKPNHELLGRVERLLIAHFNNADGIKKGLPTVEYIASELGISSNYLSNMLNILTGKSTQQHIHDKLIEKAKERLVISELSIGEIAYDLGFEYPASFNKLFKKKTAMTPKEFRKSFR